MTMPDMAMTTKSVMQFHNDHMETLMEILAEVIGQEAVDQWAAEFK